METPVPANHGMRRKTLGAVLITASALGVATTKVLSMSKAGALAPDGDPQCKKDFSFDPTGFCIGGCSKDKTFCPNTCASCPEMLRDGTTCIAVKDNDSENYFCTTLCTTDEAIKTSCPTACASCSEMLPDGYPCIAMKDDLRNSDGFFCTTLCTKDDAIKKYCPNTCESCGEMMPGGKP